MEQDFQTAMRKLHVAIRHVWLENVTVTVLLCRGFWTDTILSGRWQMLSVGYVCPPFCWISWHRMAVGRATKWLKHLVSPLYIQVFCDVTQSHSVSDYRRLEGNNAHWKCRELLCITIQKTRNMQCHCVDMQSYVTTVPSYRQLLAGVGCVCMSGSGHFEKDLTHCAFQ